MHNRHTTGADRFVIAKDKTMANDEPQMQPLVSRLIGWANPRRRFISTLHFTCGDVTSAQWWQHGHWSIVASLLTKWDVRRTKWVTDSHKKKTTYEVS